MWAGLKAVPVSNQDPKWLGISTGCIFIEPTNTGVILIYFPTRISRSVRTLARVVIWTTERWIGIPCKNELGITTIEWVPVVCECHLYFIRVYIINGSIRWRVPNKEDNFQGRQSFRHAIGWPPPANYEWIAIYMNVVDILIGWMVFRSERYVCLPFIHGTMWENRTVRMCEQEFRFMFRW